MLIDDLPQLMAIVSLIIGPVLFVNTFVLVDERISDSPFNNGNLLQVLSILNYSVRIIFAIIFNRLWRFYAYFGRQKILLYVIDIYLYSYVTQHFIIILI